MQIRRNVINYYVFQLILCSRRTLIISFPNFEESLNFKLCLDTNGMNLFGNFSTNHSTWFAFALLVIYNLPFRFCIKRKIHDVVYGDL